MRKAIIDGLGISILTHSNGVIIRGIGDWKNNSVAAQLGCDKVSFTLAEKDGFSVLVIYPDTDGRICKPNGNWQYTISGEYSKTLLNFVGRKYYAQIKEEQAQYMKYRVCQVSLCPENEVKENTKKDKYYEPKNIKDDELINSLLEIMVKIDAISKKMEDVKNTTDILTKNQQYLQSAIVDIKESLRNRA